MAFCEHCGNQLSDQATACPQCGHPGPAARRQPTSVVAAGPTSGSAIASLIFGIAGLIVCPVVCSVLAVIFGAQANKQLQADPNLQGAGMAKAGIVLGWVGIGVALLGLIVVASVGGFGS